MSLKPGDLLENRYSIVRIVRQGGMGSIYEARDSRLAGSRCAIKEMLYAGEDDDSLYLKATFEKEMQVLVRLEHPGIPRVRDFFLREGMLTIVMDFVEGANLEDELAESLKRSGAPLPPRRVVSDALAVLDLLEYLHGHEPPIVHRDVKPANLIYDRCARRIKLVDFGLARSLDSAETRTEVGTLAYCPTEQIQGKPEPRSDLYAVGATMYHLLTGHAPVPLEPPRIRQAMPGLDPDLASAVDRAVGRRPRDRFESATAMRLALEACSRKENLTVAPSPAMAGAAVPTVTLCAVEEPPALRVPWPAWALFALLLVGLLAWGIAPDAQTPEVLASAAPPAAPRAALSPVPEPPTPEPPGFQELPRVPDGSGGFPRGGSPTSKPRPATPAPAPKTVPSARPRPKPTPAALPAAAYPTQKPRPRPEKAPDATAPAESAAAPEALPEAAARPLGADWASDAHRIRVTLPQGWSWAPPEEVEAERASLSEGAEVLLMVGTAPRQAVHLRMEFREEPVPNFPDSILALWIAEQPWTLVHRKDTAPGYAASFRYEEDNGRKGSVATLLKQRRVHGRWQIASAIEFHRGSIREVEMDFRKVLKNIQFY